MLVMPQKPPPMTPEQLEYYRKLGRKGGKKGGHLAWENLTQEERSERAKKAAQKIPPAVRIARAKKAAAARKKKAAARKRKAKKKDGE